MTTRMIRIVIVVSVISLSIAGCGTEPTVVPTSLPEPTATFVPTQTPLPTSTATPIPSPTLTPIPGVEAPILVDGFGFQVSSGRVGGEPPNNFRINLEFNTPMILEFTLTGVDTSNFADFLDTLNLLMQDLVVVDEIGNVVKPSYYFLPIINADGTRDPLIFYFAVGKKATGFSLKFPDGQTIDLTPILEFR